MNGKRLGLRALVLCTFVGIAGCSGEPTGPSKGLDIRFETDIIGDRAVPYVEVIPEGPNAGCERLHVGGTSFFTVAGILMCDWIGGTTPVMGCRSGA
jgi:hypothetical protein